MNFDIQIKSKVYPYNYLSISDYLKERKLTKMESFSVGTLALTIPDLTKVKL